MLALALCLNAGLADGQVAGGTDATRIAVIPQPTKVTPRAGQFRVTRATVIWSDPASAR